jgi:hypothetical protein
LDLLTCGYRNGTDRMVIVRCVGPEAFFLERVVFPFELLSFQCPAETELEIWTHGLGGPELLESIPVQLLTLEPSGQQHQEPAGDADGLADPLGTWAAPGQDTAVTLGKKVSQL